MGVSSFAFSEQLRSVPARMITHLVNKVNSVNEINFNFYHCRGIQTLEILINFHFYSQPAGKIALTFAGLQTPSQLCYNGKHIGKQIMGGYLMKVTIRDIAREAGVSPATVSNVFNGKNKISDRTREHVLAIARHRRLRGARGDVPGEPLAALHHFQAPRQGHHGHALFLRADQQHRNRLPRPPIRTGHHLHGRQRPQPGQPGLRHTEKQQPRHTVAGHGNDGRPNAPFPELQGAAAGAGQPVFVGRAQRRGHQQPRGGLPGRGIPHRLRPPEVRPGHLVVCLQQHDRPPRRLHRRAGQARLQAR